MALTKAKVQQGGLPNNLMVKYFASNQCVSANPPVSPANRTYHGSSSGSPSNSISKHKVISSSMESMKDVTTEKGKEAKAEVQLKRKCSYETRRHFQPRWAMLYPWAEAATVDCDGNVTQVHCTICSKIEGHEFLYVPKIDGLWKHIGHKRAERDMVIAKRTVKASSFYFLGGTKHERNEKLMLACSLDIMHAQVVSVVT